MRGDDRYVMNPKDESFEMRNAQGKLHSRDDKPAIIYSNGSIQWFTHGLPHRRGRKPAAITPSGYAEYWKIGEFWKSEYLSDEETRKYLSEIDSD